MNFFKSAALVSIVPFALLACGNPKSDSEATAITNNVPQASLTHDNKVLRIMYKGDTHFLSAEDLSVYLLDHPCAELRPNMPKDDNVAVKKFTMFKVNNIAGTPTTGHIALVAHLDSCIEMGVDAVFVIKPSVNGAEPGLEYVHIAKIRGGSNVPPTTGTYAFSDVSNVSFAQSGKLLVTHGDASGSSARLVFGNPTGTAPIGQYERCELINRGESGVLCPWAN